MNSISPNLNMMIEACEKASNVIIRDFGEIENLQVAKKGPRDFVTKTDKRVEQILIEELNKVKQNYSFLTEESGKIENKDKDKIWIIDPIDGTTNFLHGIPHFAISIALKIDNELRSALIHDPIKNELFYAEKNNGAYYNNQRIRVSKKNEIEDCLFSYVGSGRLDGFFHNKINLWDIAAGILIVQEAGGTTNDFSKFDENSINIRAASSSIYPKMMKKLVNF